MPSSNTTTKVRGAYWTSYRAAAFVRDAESRGQYTWTSSFLVPARDPKGVLQTIKSIEGHIKALTRTQREEFRSWTKQYKADCLSGRAEHAISTIHAPRLKTTLQRKVEDRPPKYAASSHVLLSTLTPQTTHTSHTGSSMPKSPIKVVESHQFSSSNSAGTLAYPGQALPTSLSYNESIPDLLSQPDLGSDLLPERISSPTDLTGDIFDASYYDNEGTCWLSYHVWNNVPEYARPGYVSPYPKL